MLFAHNRRAGIGRIADINCVIMVIFHIWIEHCRNYASHLEKVSNKSCSESNFVPKSTRAHMSIYPGVRAMGLERCSKYYSEGKQ